MFNISWRHSRHCLMQAQHQLLLGPILSAWRSCPSNRRAVSSSSRVAGSGRSHESVYPSLSQLSWQLCTCSWLNNWSVLFDSARLVSEAVWSSFHSAGSHIFGQTAHFSSLLQSVRYWLRPRSCSLGAKLPTIWMTVGYNLFSSATCNSYLDMFLFHWDEIFHWFLLNYKPQFIRA